MKYRLSTLLLTIALTLPRLSFGYGLGLSFSNSFIVTGLVDTRYIFAGILFYPDPQNVSIHLTLPYRNNIQFGFSTGYGYANSFYKTDYDNPNSDDRKSEYKTNGYFYEAELVYSKPILKGSSFKPFIGLGIGNYKYKTKVNFIRDDTETKGKSTLFGLAQYFTFGTTITINKKLSTFIQFKKMGLNQLTMKEDLIDYYDGDELGIGERSSVPLFGITGIGTTIGIRINL